jgi:UDP-N-acetylmuramate dehydrogenase
MLSNVSGHGSRGAPVHDEFDRQLRAAFGDARVQRHASLAPLTTFKVGGAADWLLETRQADEIVRAFEIARDFQVPLTMLGGGSNVLVAEAGVRGLVVRMHGGDVRVIDSSRIRADGGITINGLVRWTISHGCAGLEAWAGTPGTVGGAIHGNAHFRGRLISECVAQVTLVNRDGVIADVPVRDMEFGYDCSRLQRTKEAVLAADFCVAPGEPTALRATARESLAFRKRTQPLESASAGCIFQNPDPARDRVPDGIPASAGALVDRAGLKGATAGQAMVSTTHANFIVNHGGASADQIRDLIARCKRAVRDRFGVELREEVVCLGFEGD